MTVIDPGLHYPLDLTALPKSWEVCYVGDRIPDIQSGFASGIHNQEGRGVAHLRPMNVDRLGNIDLSLVKFVADTEGPRLRDGDVLFNNTNSPELIGKTAAIQTAENWAFSNHMTRLRPPANISGKFVAHQLHFVWMSGYFKHRCVKHVNQASISSTTLARSIPLVLPPFNEQQRIVAEIEKQFTRLDAGVAALRRAQGNLKRYRAAVLKAACEGRLVPTEAELARREHRDYEPAITLLARLLNERRAQYAVGKKGKAFTQEDAKELPALPEGWAWAGMRQVGEVQLGRQRAPQHHAGKHMRPYLRVANVFEARIDTTNVHTMNFTPEEFEKYRLRSGDILLNEGQTPELVGRPAMFRDEIPNCCYQKTLLRFRAYSGLLPSFALMVFRSYMHNGRFTRAASITTNIAHLTAEKFVEIEFPLPPLAEQIRIVAESEHRLSVVEALEAVVTANLQRAGRLRQSILRGAFAPVSQHKQRGG